MSQTNIVTRQDAMIDLEMQPCTPRTETTITSIYTDSRATTAVSAGTGIGMWAMTLNASLLTLDKIQKNIPQDRRRRRRRKPQLLPGRKSITLSQNRVNDLKLCVLITWLIWLKYKITSADILC